MHPISISNLTFSYKNRKIFDHAQLRLEQNTLSGILGCNGAGKTTLFDILCGLRQAPSAHVSVPRNDLTYLSQTVWVPPALRMREVFHMINALTSNNILKEDDIFSKLYSWAPGLAIRFQDIWHKKSAVCSYGEIRCFFTFSLIINPTGLIVLDEPTAGVDPEFRHYIWMGLEQARREGATLLISSHNTDEIARHCDFFHMISQHKLERFEDEEQFKQHFMARTLDEAFINANTLPLPPACRRDYEE